MILQSSLNLLIKSEFCSCNNLVMGRTQFYRTSDELEHHFLNVEITWVCSSIYDRTWTSHFWLWMNKHRTSNLIGLSVDLLNYSSNWLKHHFFELERVHLFVIELEHPIFGFERSNIKLWTLFDPSLCNIHNLIFCSHCAFFTYY